MTKATESLHSSAHGGEATQIVTLSHLIAEFERAVIAVENAVQMPEMTPAVSEYHRTRDALLEALTENGTLREALRWIALGRTGSYGSVEKFAAAVLDPRAE